MSFPSAAPSLSRGEGTGGGEGGPLPTLGRSDGGRPPPAPSSSSTSSAAAAAAASNPSAPRAATPDDDNNNDNNGGGGAAAAAPSSSPVSENPNKRGRNPFESPVLNTYTLPGTEHSTWRRWVLELGLFLGAALAVLGPAVGLAVMTPYISVTSGLASDLRKDAECLKVAPEACPVPLRFDYYFWNITNAQAWLQGERPVLEEVGPYAFKVRELRWNANFSADKSEVTFDRLYYNEAFLADKSCPECSLDRDDIVTVNWAYLAVLGFYGGSEMPLVLPGVPTALAGVLGAFQAGIVAGGQAQDPPITYDEPTAKNIARLQWSQCFVWTPDPVALLEYCAWVQAQGSALGPEAMLDPVTADRVLGLLGSPAVGNPQASDIVAQWNALKIGLYDPPETLAAALGTTIAQARAVKGYVRHLALTLVGPGFEAFALGPKLAPASGGLVVRKTARQWIEGWTDPLLASIYGVGPASEVSAAFAWPSRDAPSRALGGRPISELKGGDHPQISRLTITTGEPLEELSSDGQGRTTYKEQLPTLLKSLDGSEFAVAPSSSSPVGVRVGGSVDGRIFHQKIKTDERGENLTLFDSTFGRPVVAHPVPSAVEIDEDQALEQASGTRFPKAGTAEAAVVYGNAGGIPARRYSLSNASASACDSGRGGVERCAAPDLFAWSWNLESVYKCPTQATLPHFLFADGAVLLANGTAASNATTRSWMTPLQASLTALAAPSMRANVSLHSWWFASEPFTGVSVAARKPYQLSFGVGPAAPEATAPALWLPPPASGSSSGGSGSGGGGGSSSPPQTSMGWVPTHWVATAFVLDGKLANDLSEGLRIVRMMKLVLSNVFPGIGLWMLSNCAWQLLGTKRAKETRAAMKVAGASRAAKPDLAGDELDEFAALLDADAAEGGGA